MRFSVGIDVSNHQGDINWDLVGASQQFAMIKATEGVGYVDAFFAQNWAEAQRVKLVRGAYHYGRPDLDNSLQGAEAEVDFFLEVLDGQIRIGDVVVLDLETGSGDLYGYTAHWLGYATDKLGFKPILYTANWFAEPHNLLGHADLAEHGLWVADYQTDHTAVPLTGWPFWAIWQYGQGPVLGVKGLCDINFFNGPIERLRLYGYLT